MIRRLASPATPISPPFRPRGLKWCLALALLCLAAGGWFALADRAAARTCDAFDPNWGWHVPLYFGYYGIYLFGTWHPYMHGCYACLALAAACVAAWGFGLAELPFRRAAPHPAERNLVPRIDRPRKRMIRRVYITASAISLLLCAATIVAWAWSERLTRPIVWQQPNRFKILEVHLAPGGIFWSQKVGIERADYSCEFWKLVVLTLVIPLWPRVRALARWESRLRQTARQRRERLAALAQGLCHVCGYDLRASNERCPECGTPIAETT